MKSKMSLKTDNKREIKHENKLSETGGKKESNKERGRESSKEVRVSEGSDTRTCTVFEVKPKLLIGRL